MTARVDALRRAHVRAPRIRINALRPAPSTVSLCARGPPPQSHRARADPPPLSRSRVERRPRAHRRRPGSPCTCSPNCHHATLLAQPRHSQLPLPLSLSTQNHQCTGQTPAMSSPPLHPEAPPGEPSPPLDDSSACRDHRRCGPGSSGELDGVRVCREAPPESAPVRLISVVSSSGVGGGSVRA
jgi:hypothetical protein